MGKTTGPGNLSGALCLSSKACWPSPQSSQAVLKCFLNTSHFYRHAIYVHTHNPLESGNDPKGAGLALIPCFTGEEPEAGETRGQAESPCQAGLEPEPPIPDLLFPTPKL